VCETVIELAKEAVNHWRRDWTTEGTDRTVASSAKTYVIASIIIIEIRHGQHLCVTELVTE